MKDLNVENTVLFKQLLLVEDNSLKLSQKVVNIVNHVTPLLARIPENMREYTLHDETHSLKVIRIMGRIIPSETLVQLNDIELTFLILSAYLHDVGMTCSSSEREEIIIGSTEYQTLLKIDSMYGEYLNYEKIGNHRAITRIEDKIFTEYLRRNHVKRSADFIESTLSDGEFKLAIDDILLYKYLINICNSHGEPVTCLKDNRKYPRNTLIGEKYVNVQYLSLILRLADILDLDPERTPKVIYDFVSPEDPTSIKEWKKHRSIIGWDISSNRVVFEAECTSPEVERALRIFMEWIEIERKESLELLNNYHDDISNKYLLLLKEPLNMDRIRSDGSYIYSDVKFQLHYEKIIELLMGQRLYRNPITALREMLQNAIDAIKARHFLYSNKSEKFEPKVTIEYKEGFLVIEDNGIGMDDQVFSEFFLQVGTSYYKHPRFSGTNLDVVSEFGIGVLSAFMVADSMVIESRMEPENPLTPPSPIYYEIPTAHSYCVKRYSERLQVGTKITLKLKKEHPFSDNSIFKVVKEIIPTPPFPIHIIATHQEYIHKGVPIDNNPKFDETLDKVSYNIDARRHTEKSFSHYLFEVDLNNMGDITLEGRLQIVNGQTMNFDSQLFGYITQRSFNLGTPGVKEGQFKLENSKSLKELFPKWTNVNANINIFGGECLTVTPDRTEVIRDEKFKKIKIALEHAIISTFQKHLDKYKEDHSLTQYHDYIDLLFEAGFLGMPGAYNSEQLSDEAKAFFQNYVSFPVLTEEGSVVRKFGDELLSSNTLGIFDRYWNGEVLGTMGEFVVQQKMPVIALREFKVNYTHIIENLIFSIFGNVNDEDADTDTGNYLLTPIPGTRIEILYPKGETKVGGTRLNKYEVAEEILIDINDKSKKIICIPSTTGGYYHIFNKSHPIISPLFNGASFINRTSEEIFYKLRKNFSIIMNKFVRTIDDPENAQWQRTLRNSSHPALSIGLFYYMPEAFEKMKEAIDIYWNELIREDLVNETLCPEVRISDFPWYWNIKRF
ncbi:HD domain-containing protein [Paenibacillus medicaginis]|uniref:ATP-binding protein n=1 Tax=Paenibacillus medicaginis TaxID=1470560 RepID=A0ABV5BWS3_9BACL